ncbi:V-type ATP synthase subunit F [Microbispora sp. H11081]|uniref:V-type ATP synthase subunit F n=1 Tax=Microbispora sp. H11081 TaxID=2729107 RepID=UPI001B8D18B6|nr:V-type ATP synthase subunit F [Microbispora sp. H11081]
MTVIGEAVRVAAFGLAGALVRPAEDAEAVRAAWRTLEPHVAVVVLTPRAAEALGDEVARAVNGGPLTVVMPE